MNNAARSIVNISGICKSILLPRTSWHLACRGIHRGNPRYQQSKFYENQRAQKASHNKGYGLLIIPAFTFCLGTWQVRRRQWKLNLIQDLEERTQAPPVAYPENLDDLKDLEYHRVVVRGTFDHSRELYVTPRSPIGDEHGGRGMVSQKAQIGAQVITPFKLAGRDVTILVNRGWVSREQMNPAKRPQGQMDGEVELTGVVRHTEKRPPFGATNNPAKGSWHNRDINQMAEQVQTDPYFIDADANSTVPGGPVGGQTRVTLRNEHLSYIFTWYTLSLATFAMWFSKYRMIPK